MKPLKKPTRDNPYYWIEKYALAQCHIGIERTLEIKRDIVGYEPLTEAPMRKLKKLIYVLREEFKNNKVILTGGEAAKKEPLPFHRNKDKGEVCESIHRY
tara:strand:- start:9258 stop:9557 length:300 start_codon:yes stop_codon:yes gene_type:complete